MSLQPSDSFRDFPSAPPGGSVVGDSMTSCLGFKWLKGTVVVGLSALCRFLSLAGFERCYSLQSLLLAETVASFGGWHAERD